jgi:hypothetical protein
MPNDSKSSPARTRRLAGSISALFALSSPPAMAAPTTWTVNSCSDATSGIGTTGTLRYAVQNAASGDVIDLSTLTCSTITLRTGSVVIPQNDLTMNGPGRDALVITGDYNGVPEQDRILTHHGSGTLALNDLSLMWGYLKVPIGNALGGCIYSAGTVSGNQVGLYDCETYFSNSLPFLNGSAGGAVYAKNGIDMSYSVVAGNTARDNGGSFCRGGALMSPASIVLNFTTVQDNKAEGTPNYCQGGGVYASGDLVLFSSTVSNNYSAYKAGGIAVNRTGAGSGGTYISESTISGNSAGTLVGGLYTDTATVVLANSTIAFNTAAKGRTGSASPYSYFAPGIALSDGKGPVTVTMHSTLIANNTYGSPSPLSEYDLSVPKRSSTTVSFNAAPANNLVRVTFAAVPADTIVRSCPLLGPLRVNGGFTPTHALFSASPGFGTGADYYGDSFDQRGSPFVRVANGAVDIGAYEVQRADAIFSASFEGCPLLF